MSFKAETFSEHIDPFLSYRQRVGYATQATVRSDRIDLKLFENHLLKNNIETVNGASVIAFQEYLSAVRKNSPPSANRKIFTLRAYQDYLRLKETPYAEDLPFKYVLKIRDPKPHKPNYLKPDEIKKLFKAINKSSVLGLRDCAITACMYLLGMRVGEVHRLNLCDIDFYNKGITVTGKRNRKRTLPLNHQMKDILETYLAVRQNIYKSDENEALFISKKGKRIAVRTIEDNFKKLTERTKISKRFAVTCHTLRHSCATELNEKGVKILIIQDILGHATPKTTMNYYLHANEERIRDALEGLPVVKYLNELVNSGQIRFTFQNRYHNTG
jgi:site-specific recombinase XerD